MRVELRKGKQKELLYLFKNRNSFTWNEFAGYLGVSYSALKEWYLENCLLPLEIFEILNDQCNFEDFILEIKNENWGQSLGGNISRGSTKNIQKPRKSEELAELIGIILGDGNINFFKEGKKVGTYSLRIYGHAEYDFEFIANFVSSLITELFGITPLFYISKTSKVCYITVNSKELVEFLLKIGLKKGNKVKNQVGVPLWIKNNLTGLLRFEKNKQ